MRRKTMEILLVGSTVCLKILSASSDSTTEVSWVLGMPLYSVAHDFRCQFQNQQCLSFFTELCLCFFSQE